MGHARTIAGARKLLLVVGAMLAALLLAGSAAIAETDDFDTLEVTDEASGEHCAEVVLDGHDVSGGCEMHVVSGEVVMQVDVFGSWTTVSVCEAEATARLDEGGEGYLSDVNMSGAFCTRTPCDEANGTDLPWEAHADETYVGQTIELAMCTRATAAGAGSPGVVCTTDADVVDVGGHGYEFAADESVGHGAGENCRITATWATEDGNVEIGRRMHTLVPNAMTLNFSGAAPQTREVTYRNTGTEELNLSTIELLGTDTTRFSIVFPLVGCPPMLAPDATCHISVRKIANQASPPAAYLAVTYFQESGAAPLVQLIN